MQLLQPPVTSSIFGQDTLLRTLFSKPLNPFSSLNVKNQDSHPYKTGDKIVLLYILIVIFSDTDGKRL
jgi:hypothetical protein